MKTITLIPIKNEAWILDYTLSKISQFSDYIIISDQHSTDYSINICKKYKNIVVIKNENTGHNNSVRWQLLDKSRELFGINNLIFCIDADEEISFDALEKIKKIIKDSENKNISFSFPWIQLWGSTKKYRCDSVWKKNNKTVAFYDNGLVDYDRKLIINDHTARIPRCTNNIHLDNYPLLHYQYINLQQSEIKQIWYQCSELISGLNPKKINHKYSIAKDSKNIILKDTPKGWVMFPDLKIEYDMDMDWRYKEIMNWFDKYGIKHFEPLDIWHIKELEDMFIKATGRKPKVQKFPSWLIFINDIKNIIKNKLK